MSNALGVPAMRRFYSIAAPDFFHRRVALDAFRAGNDLLYLADFSPMVNRKAPRPISKLSSASLRIDITTTRTLPAASMRQCAGFSSSSSVSIAAGLVAPSSPDAVGNSPLIPLSNVMVSESRPPRPQWRLSGPSRLVMGKSARNAVTILFPDPATQTEPLPPPFRVDDNILIFSDSRLVQCADCTAEAAIGPDEVANIIKRLYGAEATGQIDPDRVTSLTFVDLNMFLDSQRKAANERGSAQTLPITPSVSISPTVAITLPAMLTTFDLEALVTGVPAALFQDRNAKTADVIEGADWIIFAMLDVNPERYPNSDAVARFFREYGDELADQKLVVLALTPRIF